MFSNKNSDWFGGLFDFNNDGKTSSIEQFLAVKMFEECFNEEDENDDDNFDLHLDLSTTDPLDEDDYFDEDYDFSEDEDYQLEENQYIDDEINPDEFPNTRRYLAAFELDNLPDYANDEYLQHERAICKFILEKSDSVMAANYLNYEEGFLYAQAIKDNFDLPFSLPDEDEKRLMTFPAVLCKIVRHDVALSFKIWTWCFEQFLPYSQYYDLCDGELSTDVIIELYKFPEEYMSELAHYISKDEKFCNYLLTASKKGVICMGELIATAIKEKLYETAKILFKFELEKAGEDYKEINSLTNSVLINCISDDELEQIEFFRDNLFSIVKSLPIEMVQYEIPNNEKFISSIIERVETTSPNYEYSRKYAWRKEVEDGTKYGLNPIDFISQEQYLETLNERKYGWRSFYEFRNNYGLNVNDYETQNEFRAALKEKTEEIRRQINEQAITNLDLSIKAKTVEYENDTKIYTYCGVKFSTSSRIYSYRTEDTTIKIGDKVIVPVGKDEKESEGKVVYVGQYSRCCVPYPVEKTKMIIRKL